MTPIAPASHVDDALALTSAKEVELWTITLRDGSTFRIRNGPAVTWQGVTFENMPIMMSGEEQTADDKTSRPILRAFNPAKIFGPFAHQGLFNLAVVKRQTVLQQNLLANANLYMQNIWIIGRVQTVTSELMEVELRLPTDGPNMATPTRTYSPPDFPYVSY